MNTEVQNSPVNNLPAMAGSWGSEGTSSTDLVISRITLQHDLSFRVKNKQAAPGDFVNSTSGQVFKKPLEIIPLKTYREWIVTDANTQKLVQRILIDETNEAWGDKGVSNGQPVLRVKMLNFFVVLPDYIDELPFLISFKKSGMYAGKILSTHFQTSAMKQLPPARHTFLLDSEVRTSNNKTYWAPVIKPGRAASENELKTAYTWYCQLKNTGARVEEEDSSLSQDGPHFE